MNEQDTPMDALDQRLVTYLRGRAEAQASLAPGVDAMTVAIDGGGHAAFPVRPGRNMIAGVPAWAWGVVIVSLLVVLALSAAAGTRRDNGLVVIPTTEPAVAISPLLGTWWLDFAASGIDDTYGGALAAPSSGVLKFANLIWFGDGGVFQVWTGAGGGCRVNGTWQARDDGLRIELPTGQNGCELTGPGPAARLIRERLSTVTRFAVAGTTLTLSSGTASRPLVYSAPRDANGQVRLALWSLGPLELDVEASGIVASYTRNSGRKVMHEPVYASITFRSDGTVVGAMGGGAGCDQFTGVYRDDLDGFDIVVGSGPGHCGDGPRYPDRDVRVRLDGAATYEFRDGALRLYDVNERLLLVYRPRAAEAVATADVRSRVEALHGAWWLDFPGSGIDDRYAGTRGITGWRFKSGVSFEPDGQFRLSSGAVGGCDTIGTWQAGAGSLTVNVPTGADPCEVDGPGPAAREIRQRLARSAGFAVDGPRLTILDGAGATLLVFDRSPDGNLWRLLPEEYLGAWHLDFEASGIEGSYLLYAGGKRSAVPVGSGITFADGVVTGGTGAGGGCDAFEGSYADVPPRLTITVPAAEGHCGPGPVYPDLEVRQRLVRTAAWEANGDALRLFDEEGTLLLFYRRSEAAAP